MRSEALTENVTLLRFTDRMEFADRVAADVAIQLKRDLAQRERAAIAVSGGLTPAPIFDRLKADLSLPWERITVTLADERWVPESDADSTAGMLRKHLLLPHTPFIPLVSDHATPMAGLQAIDTALQALPLPFTSVLLGMGEDGHTASLFPNHPTLKDAFDPAYGLRVVGLDDSPKPPPMRISLTCPVLMNTGRIILHLTGAGKIDILKEALANEPVEAMPIRIFLRQQGIPVDIYYCA